MIGIYKITNIINNKIYIGQSVDIARRWRQHKSSNLKYPLYNDFALFGLSNFKFEIICECKKEDLDALELTYINKYKSYDAQFGYNQTIGNGIYGHGIIFTYDTIYNLYDDLQYTNLTKTQLATKYNCNERTIRDINNGITWHQDNISYPIRSYFISELDNKKHYSFIAKSEDKFSFCPECGAKMCSTSKLCKKCTNKNYKVFNISEEELSTLLSEYPVTEVAKKFAVSHTTIRRWCKKFNIFY